MVTNSDLIKATIKPSAADTSVCSSTAKSWPGNVRFFQLTQVGSLEERGKDVKRKHICMCTLSMNHSTVHNSGYDAVVKVIHFQSDALEETTRGQTR